jgi:hypothetical protein
MMSLAFAGNDDMRHAIIAAIALCLGATASVQALADDRGTACIARVLHSEELPYAWMGSWLANVTLEVIPPGGAPFIATLHHNVSWQQGAPRRGETFSIRCDPSSGSLIY